MTVPLLGVDTSPIPASEIIMILRNVTGRIDASDPLFTDEIMLNYLNRFLSQQSSQDIRIFKNYTWWIFEYGVADPNTGAFPNPLPVDLQALGVTTIGPPAYVIFPNSAQLQAGVNTPNGAFELNWYINPALFYMRWPDIPTPYTPQRPTSVLYYNNELTFRGPPDQTYTIKIQAYSQEVIVESDNSQFQNYLYRYAAYGAALDIFSDYGETDKWRDIYPMFQRYRGFVYARTNQQYMTTRTPPEF